MAGDYERDWNERRRHRTRDREERGPRDHDDRGPLDRAGDEMRSWFGDEEAERRRRQDTRERGGPWGRAERYGPDDPRGWDPGHRYGWAGSGRDYDRNFGRYRGGYFPGDLNRGFSSFGRRFGPDFTSDFAPDEYRYGSGARPHGTTGFGPEEDDVADYGRGRYAPGPHTGRGPQGYQRSNERIIEDVNERLTRHGRVDASGIRVTAEDGEVTLEGTVDSRRAKRMAEDAAEDVPGVRDVHNRLRIERG